MKASDRIQRHDDFDRRGQATCLGNLTASSSAQGQLERSVELNTRALALFRDLQMSVPQERTAYNLALAASRDGKLEQASGHFKEAGEACQADGQIDFVLRAAVGRADIAGWIALSELELLRNELLSDQDPVRVQVASEAVARRFAALGEARDESRAWLLVIDAQLSRKKRDDARRTLDKVKTASKSFSDRTLSFDLEWAEAWISEGDERTLRLRALQHRAREEGYVAHAIRAEQALAALSSKERSQSESAIPVPAYARIGITDS